MSLTYEQQYRIRNSIETLLDKLKNFHATLERMSLPQSYKEVAYTTKDIFSSAGKNHNPINLPACFISQLSLQREKSIELMENILRGMFIADTKTLKYIGVLDRNTNIVSDEVANEVKREVVARVIEYFNIHDTPGLLTQECKKKVEEINGLCSIKNDEQKNRLIRL